jgi:SET domain
MNAFGFPLTSLSSHLGKDSPDEEHEGKHYHSCGIWVQASYINHSCYSNVRRSFLGDMQIIRAARDIPADTELTFWYQVPDTKGYAKRQEKLQNWGFQCKCVMCTEEKNTPAKNTKKREALLGDLRAAFVAPSGVQLPKIERLLKALEQTYKTSSAQVARLALWEPYLLLARMYAAQDQAEKVITIAPKALASLGFVIKGAEITPSAEATRSNAANVSFVVEQWGLVFDRVVEAWVHLWKAYKHVAPQLGGQAEECARTAYRICVGEDVTFDEYYG